MASGAATVFGKNMASFIPLLHITTLKEWSRNICTPCLAVLYTRAIGQCVRYPRIVKRSSEIGSKLIFFDQDKVYIGDDVYPLSKGLLELLFKKIPDEKLIEDQDLKHYKDILLKSNAHRVQNRSSGRLRTSNVPKFR